MNIIIVEDDALIAYQIESCIKSLGHALLGTFDNAQSALESITDNKPDFAFMDIEINGPIDGIQCATLLKNRFDIPSIFVTSHDGSEIIDEATRLEPLNFLPKPFTDKNIEAAVSLAKIKLGKPPSPQERSVIQLGSYSFNFEHNTLKYKDTLFKLSPKELKLVAMLFKNLGNTLSNEAIQQEIWGDKPVSSAACRKLISRTNENLQGLAIRSSKGVGYYLQEIS